MVPNPPTTAGFPGEILQSPCPLPGSVPTRKNLLPSPSASTHPQDLTGSRRRRRGPRTEEGCASGPSRLPSCSSHLATAPHASTGWRCTPLQLSPEDNSHLSLLRTRIQPTAFTLSCTRHPPPPLPLRSPQPPPAHPSTGPRQPRTGSPAPRCRGRPPTTRASGGHLALAGLGCAAPYEALVDGPQVLPPVVHLEAAQM